MHYIIPRPLEFSYVPQRPFIAPAIIAAGVTAAGSLLGGLLGSGSQRSANKTNLQIAREANVNNQRLLDKQNAFNLDMWNKFNEYTTPLAQRQRYEQAGINPYFAMSNISSGNPASALTSAPSQPTVTSQVQPIDYSFIGQAANNAANVYSQLSSAQKAAADADAVHIENAYRPAMMVATLRKTIAETEKTFGDTSLSRLAYKVQKAAYQDTLDTIHEQAVGAKLDNNLKQLQMTQTSLEISIRSFYHQNIQPQEAKQLANQIDLLTAQIAATNAQTKLTEKQVEYYATQVAAQVMSAQASLISANASMKNANTNASLAPHQADLIDSQASVARETAVNTRTDTWSKRQQFNFFRDAAKDRLNILKSQSAMAGSDATFRPFTNFTHLVPIGSLAPNY